MERGRVDDLSDPDEFSADGDYSGVYDHGFYDHDHDYEDYDPEDYDEEEEVNPNWLTFESTDREHCGGISSLVLLIGDGDRARTLYASREVLSVASPVFARMFSPDNGFKEADSSEIVKIPDEDPDEFVGFLQHFYATAEGEVNGDSLEYLARLADKYDVPHLTKRCEKFLCSDDCWQIGMTKKMEIADRYGWQNAKDTLLNMQLATGLVNEHQEEEDGDD